MSSLPVSITKHCATCCCRMHDKHSACDMKWPTSSVLLVAVASEAWDISLDLKSTRETLLHPNQSCRSTMISIHSIYPPHQMNSAIILRLILLLDWSSIIRLRRIFLQARTTILKPDLREQRVHRGDSIRLRSTVIFCVGKSSRSARSSTISTVG
jgi:hypothetical protein